MKINVYIKKVYGYILSDEEKKSIFKSLIDTYNPPTKKSKSWKQWVADIDIKTCLLCRNLNGKIYAIGDDNFEEPPLHSYCRCEVLTMAAVVAGDATKDGKNGADFWIKYIGRLPDYYISKEEINNLGWNPGKSPQKFSPNKMIAGGIYRNRNNHLPQIPGRFWYEADINYYEGRRNRHRLLWSNDGLIFVTYDHYETFYEIV